MASGAKGSACAAATTPRRRGVPVARGAPCQRAAAADRAAQRARLARTSDPVARRSDAALNRRDRTAHTPPTRSAKMQSRRPGSMELTINNRCVLSTPHRHHPARQPRATAYHQRLRCIIVPSRMCCSPPPFPKRPLPFPTRRYRLGRKIGSGSFGDIYLATNIVRCVGLRQTPALAQPPALASLPPAGPAGR